VYDAMNGCLACKACATQCPVKVDIPHMRSEFLAHYHSRYRRPLKDHLVATQELSLIGMGRIPRLINWFFRKAWFQKLLERWAGIVDSPLLSELRLERGLAARGAPKFDPRRLATLSAEQKRSTVLVAQDAFTTFYESNVALAAYDVLTRLGLNVVFLPYRQNGKGLHIKGFLDRFKNVVRDNTRFFAKVAELGIPIVGIEPAVTLTYRDEYPKALGHGGRDRAGFHVLLLQEYLHQKLPELAPAPKAAATPAPLLLFGHCTERTEEAKSQEQWRTVFRHFGLELVPRAVGCCGMCGIYGHEAEHYRESKGVFEMSWAKQLPKDAAARGNVLAPGHSCRSQVKRFAGFIPRHPIEALRDALVPAAPAE
jgi:Fe-S oxidoreductase